MEEISDDEAKSFEDKCTFLWPFYFFPWWFWYGSPGHWLWHFKEQSRRKRKLTQKFGSLEPYRRKSFCYWYYRERLKNPIFYYFPSASIFFPKIIIQPFRTKTLLTCTVKELLKSGRIKEIRAPSCIVYPLIITQNSHNKARLILNLLHINSFCL